ncbi:MAG: hypothetical protein NW241_10340 [Bacteroidia bacterium]|nr:hypothetical protein [Bacteroidia bacterium]
MKLNGIQLAWLAAALLLPAGAAQAQYEMGLLLEAPHSAQIQMTAAPHLALSAQYLRASERLRAGGSPLGIGVSASLPLSALRGFDLDVSAGIAHRWMPHPAWQMLSSLRYGLSATRDLNGQFVHHGLRMDLCPGRYGRRWMLAAHLSLDYRPFVHIRHSAYAQQAFEGLPQDGPQDGWYTQHLLFSQYGLCAAYRRGRWNAHAGLDYRRAHAQLGRIVLPDIGILPFSGSLGLGFALGSGAPPR